MSWLDRVRNALPFTAKRDTADNLWHKCRQCQQMVFVKEWADNLNVCPRCDHHDRIGAKERFAQLFDGGLYEVLPAPAAPEDPLDLALPVLYWWGRLSAAAWPLPGVNLRWLCIIWKAIY